MIKQQDQAENVGVITARTSTLSRNTTAKNNKTTPKITNHNRLPVRAGLARLGGFNEGTNRDFVRLAMLNVKAEKMSSSVLSWFDGLVLARSDALTSEPIFDAALGAPIVPSVECAADLEATEGA